MSTLALLLLAVLSAAAAQVIVKHGMMTAANNAERSSGSLVIKAITCPWVLLGMAVFAASAVAWLATLSTVPLSIAYPFNAIGYLALLAASTFILGERTTVWTWFGTALVAVGLVIVVLTMPRADPATSSAPPDQPHVVR